MGDTQEQANNSRRNHHITINGHTQSIADWARELGFSPIIILQSGTHVVIAVEIARTTLHRHRRFLELLLQAATPSPTGDDE